MEIPREQAEKLKRYFINADPFLWGVLENKNKKGRLQELRKLGFLMGYSEGSNATYSRMNQDLLVELGIEGILERIIVPQVIKNFTPEVLRYFRRCWEQGQTPDMKYLKEHQLYRRRPFSDHPVCHKQCPLKTCAFGKAGALSGISYPESVLAPSSAGNSAGPLGRSCR